MSSKTGSAHSNGKKGKGFLLKLVIVLLFLVGLFWLGDKTNWIALKHVHPAIFWPMAVLEVGLFFVFRASRKKRRQI